MPGDVMLYIVGIGICIFAATAILGWLLMSGDEGPDE